MARHFHEDLRALTGRLTVMGALVESRVRDAMTALLQRNPDLAVTVATGDAAVNELELEVASSFSRCRIPSPPTSGWCVR